MQGTHISKVAEIVGVKVSTIDLLRRKRGSPAPTISKSRERLFCLDCVLHWMAENPL